MVIFFIILTLVLLVTEYFSYLTPKSKVVLTLFYFLSLFISLFFLILIPFFEFLGIKKSLSNEKINEIIVSHFPDVKDRLLNIFELNNSENNSNLSSELLIASIDQKITSIKTFDFNEAISFKNNLKALLIAFLFMFVSTLILIINPYIFSESKERLSNINTYYEKPSPFNYQILSVLEVPKGNNYELLVNVETEKEFDILYIEYGGNSYLMKNDSLSDYSYFFPSINNTLQFNFKIDNYKSKPFIINVLPQPILSSFTIKVDKPAYINQKNEFYDNITGINVPIGSICTFTFNTYDTDSVLIISSNDSIILKNKPFEFKKKILENNRIDVSLINSNFSASNVISVDIQCLNDLFPAINVDQLIDSIDFSRIYFRGNIEDDYGFSKLNFITKVNNYIDETNEIEIIKNLTNQNFLYAFNFEKYKSTESRIDYYFEIFDNDAVSGNKSSVSQLFSFTFPDIKDIFEYQDEQFDNIDELLSKSNELTNQIKNDLEDLKYKMLNSNLSDWEKRESIKNIYSKKQDLESALKNIQERNEELDNYLQSFTDQNKDILEKQELIQDMLDEVMSDEIKTLMDELNKLMEQMNDNSLNQLKEKLDISLDDLSKQLDRNIEMLKKLKIEQQLNQIVDQLNQRKDKLNSLNKKVDDGDLSNDLNDEIVKEKEQLTEIQDQYNAIQDLNEQLENQLNLYDFDKEFNEIEKEFEKTSDNIEKNNKSKSKESLQKNSKNLENLSFMMQQMLEAAFEEQNSENLSDLIQILDNLIIFSHQQEIIFTKPNNIEFHNDILTAQKKLFSDFSVIKDSLYALAMREPSINMVVNKEIVSIENNFRIINKEFDEARVQQAKVNQQLVMTSANNLALFMSEVIKNLQQQMANSMPGNQNCQKPGNNPNPSSMGNSLKQMQKSMQQQLEKMMQMMRDGKSGNQMQGEMGKALAEQEKMKNMLQQMMNQGNVGSGAYETLKQADQLLDKVREDIIRNNINDNTVKRQQQILTRLLEAESAENEREFEEKRKSTTAQQQRVSETAKFFDNLNSNDKFEERLLREKLMLNKFYQQKYQRYVNQLDSIIGSNN